VWNIIWHNSNNLDSHFVFFKKRFSVVKTSFFFWKLFFCFYKTNFWKTILQQKKRFLVQKNSLFCTSAKKFDDFFHIWWKKVTYWTSILHFFIFCTFFLHSDDFFGIVRNFCPCLLIVHKTSHSCKKIILVQKHVQKRKMQKTRSVVSYEKTCYKKLEITVWWHIKTVEYVKKSF
jgi:hypothetical protein